MKMLMPQIGMTMVEGTIENWLKHEGDTVTKGEIILEISTEKMVNEIEAPASGVLHIIANEGEIIACSEPIAEIN